MRPADRKRGPKVMEQDIAFDASIDDDEPTTEELVEMLRQALHEAETGQTRPIEELLQELNEILTEHEDAGRDYKNF